MTPKQRLAAEIETAIAKYVATDSFPSSEFPDLAIAVADVIEGASVYDRSAGTTVVNSQELVRRLATLVTTVAAIVE